MPENQLQTRYTWIISCLFFVIVVATDQWDSWGSLYFLYLSSRFKSYYSYSKNLSYIYILFTMFSKVQILKFCIIIKDKGRIALLYKCLCNTLFLIVLEISFGQCFITWAKQKFSFATIVSHMRKCYETSLKSWLFWIIEVVKVHQELGAGNINIYVPVLVLQNLCGKFF